MSTPRKKNSRADQEQKIRYNSILSVPLHLADQKDLNAREKHSANDQDDNFLSGGRRATDFHMIGRLDQWTKLSSREREVTYLVCRRKRNEEIAAEMGVTVGTVNSYLNHIYNKLDLRGKMDLFHLFHDFDFRSHPPY